MSLQKEFNICYYYSEFLTVFQRSLCKRVKKVWSFGAVYESFEEYLRKKCYFYIEIVDKCNRQWYNDFDISI